MAAKPQPNSAIDMEPEDEYTTTLRVTAVDPNTKTKAELIGKELLEELTNKVKDPKYGIEYAKGIIKLLEDIKQYEETIVLNKVIGIIDKGLANMQTAEPLDHLAIRELKKLRDELMKHVVKHDMSEATLAICQQATMDTMNQRLRLEIQLKRKHPAENQPQDSKQEHVRRFCL